MTPYETALSNVQNLYLMQTQLWQLLDAKNLTDAQRNDARKYLREFASLLRNADWRLMGGEDVYAGLKQMEREAAAKLSQRGSMKKKSKR